MPTHIDTLKEHHPTTTDSGRTSMLQILRLKQHLHAFSQLDDLPRS